MGDISDNLNLLQRQIKPLEDALEREKARCAELEKEMAVNERELVVVRREHADLKTRNDTLVEQNAAYEANLRTAAQALLAAFDIKRNGSAGLARFTPKSAEQKQLEGVASALSSELTTLNARTDAPPAFLRDEPNEPGSGRRNRKSSDGGN
jgi:chromosome segregation ATPase